MKRNENKSEKKNNNILLILHKHLSINEKIIIIKPIIKS